MYIVHIMLPSYANTAMRLESNDCVSVLAPGTIAGIAKRQEGMFRTDGVVDVAAAHLRISTCILYCSLSVILRDLCLSVRRGKLSR